MKRFVLLIFSIGLLALLCLLWFRNPEPYPRCGLAKSVHYVESGVLADIKQWFYKIFKKDPSDLELRYYMMDLSVDDQAKLELILSSYDFKMGGVEFSEEASHGFISSFIVVGKDGEAHILSMFRKLPGLDKDLLRLSKIEYDRNGLWKESEGKARYFISPKLYRELDEFIRSLPLSNIERLDYEILQASYDSWLRDERQGEKEKN